MTNKQLKTKRGFTIIEVVLVLAIAGLIFMMVFLALPALQRSQRDTQRRDDMSRFAAQIQQYQSNNRGNVPKTAGVSDDTKDNDWGNFLKNYLQTNGDDFTDPSGEKYQVNDKGSLSSGTGGYANGSDENKFDGKTITVYHSAKCGTEQAEYLSGSSTRKIAILYKLEGAGTYCGEL